MCSPDLFANIHDFSVDTFDRLLSDKHCPINITINVENNNINKQRCVDTDDNIANPIVEKVKWDDKKEEDYKREFDMNKIHTLDLNVDSIMTNVVTRDGIEDISKYLNDIFLEPAKSVGMCKSINTSSKHKNTKSNKPWFNNACKNSKTNYWKHKRSLSKTSNTENITLKNLAKQHKRLIRQVKRKYDKDFNDRLKYLKTFNPGEYWRIINNGKKKG